MAVALLASAPYKRDEDDVLAITCQVLIITCFVGAILVDVFNSFVSVARSINQDDPTQLSYIHLGFRNVEDIINVMIIFAFGVMCF